MATVKKLGIKADNQFGGHAPFGNKTVLTFRMQTNASGVLQNSDTTTAVGATDKIVLGILPAGMLLQDAQVIISDAFAATITGKVGFEYVDGSDSSSVPQDDDYFFAAGLDMATAARTRASRALAPVKLPEDAYLIYTNAVAAHDAAGIADFLIEGVMDGAP